MFGLDETLLKNRKIKDPYNNIAGASRKKIGEDGTPKFPFLKSEKETGAYYTDHGIPHSERIIILLDNFLNKFQIGLTEGEIGILLSSIWSHDTGMFDLREDDKTIEDVRREHEIRSMNFLDNIDIDDDLKEVVKEVVKAHRRKYPINSLEYESQKLNITHGNIRLRLLGALLRLGDACDVNKERTPIAIFENVCEKEPYQSREEWMRHMCISSVEFKPSDNTILLHVNPLKGVSSNKIKELAEKTKNHIEQEIESIKDVLVDPDYIKARPINLKVELDKIYSKEINGKTGCNVSPGCSDNCTHFPNFLNSLKHSFLDIKNNSTIARRLTINYLSALEKGRLLSGKELVKELDKHDDKVSESTCSTDNDMLSENGIFYEIKPENGKLQEFFINPFCLVYLATFKNEKAKKFFVEENKYSDCITKYENCWKEHFSKIIKKSCTIPVMGWISEIAYGHIIGWLHFLSSELENSKVIFLTPNLHLLRNSWGIILQKYSESKNIKYEFICTKESFDKCEEEFKKNKANNFYILSSEAPFIEDFRISIFENKDGSPIFGLEAIKQKEMERYVGTLYYRDDKKLNRIKKDIDEYKEKYYTEKVTNW